MKATAVLATLAGTLALLPACGGGGGDAGASTSGTTAAGGTSTAAVLCGLNGSEFNASASVRLTATYAWACTGTARTLTANGVPDHEVGTFPNANNPNAIGAQAVSASTTLTPALAAGSTAVTVTAYALNGVKMDPGTAGTCNDAGNNCNLGAGGTGSWRIEALGQSAFNFGTDDSRAHVQPGGAYHYHGIPEKYLVKLGATATAMTLVGWAADGFPVYARYGHTVATDATSPLKVLRGSWQLKATPDAGRPAVALYAMGAFTQDYQYVAGSGDLDECNGRSGVTPEFPGGIYHYVLTDSYPFIGRCAKGTPAGWR